MIAIPALLALSWLGCPRPSTLPVPPAVPEPAPEAPLRTPIEGPRYWTESGGLCLEIPEGWAGTAGHPPMLLDLVQASTGYGFQVRAWPASESTPPREGYEILFEDPNGYRTVPILGPDAGSRTWVPTDGSGGMITSWFAPLDARIVEISISTPLGHITEGRTAVGPLAQNLCKTFL